MFYVHVAAVKLTVARSGGEWGSGEGEVYHKVATPQNMTATATVVKASRATAVKKVSEEILNVATARLPNTLARPANTL